MPEARWEALYRELRVRIERRELAPGDRVPTEQELIAETGLSRTTVRNALTALESAGLIHSTGPGRGGRIVRGAIRTGTSGRAVAIERMPFNMSRFELGAFVDDPRRGVDQWKLGVEDAGWVPRQEIAGVERLPAPHNVATWLGIETGAEVVRRRRLRFVSRPQNDIGESLAMIADTWTPIDIAERTYAGVAPLLSATDVTLPGGIYHALGFRQVRFIDEIEARMPTADEAELMELPIGTPVGQHARVGIDTTGRRVRVIVHVWAGDRQTIVYEHDVPDRRLPNTPSPDTGAVTAEAHGSPRT